MESEEIQKILNEEFAARYSGEIYKKGRETYAKLKIQEAAGTAAGSFADAERTLAACGRILTRQDGTLTALLGSGIKNMNPALLEVHASGDGLAVSAWAKEGLLPQHTAEKAIRTFQKELNGDER